MSANRLVIVAGTVGAFDNYVRAEIDRIGRAKREAIPSQVRRDAHGWTVAGTRYVGLSSWRSEIRGHRNVEAVILGECAAPDSELASIVAAVRNAQGAPVEPAEVTIDWRPRRVMVLGSRIGYATWVRSVSRAHKAAAGSDPIRLAALENITAYRIRPDQIAAQFAGLTIRCDLLRVSGWDAEYTDAQVQEAQAAWSEVAAMYGGSSWTTELGGA